MNHKLEEEEDIHKKYIYNCDNGRAQPYFKSPCHWAQIHAGAVFFKKKITEKYYFSAFKN